MSLLICAPGCEELYYLAPSILPVPDKILEMQPMAITVKNRELVFCATGIGIINTALAMGVCFGLALQHTNSLEIEGVIYAGLASAFDLEKTPLKTICLVSEEIWPEYGLNDGSNIIAHAFKKPQWQKSESSIFDRIKLNDLSDLNLALKKDTWQKCLSLTVSGVTASFARREKLWNTWQAELENMEGFAAAYAAARAEKPIVEIRVVSNKAGPRSKEEKDMEGALQTLSQILPELKLV